MSCTNCGNSLTPNASFCVHCGARIQYAAAYGTPCATNRVANHLRSVAVLWLAYAALRAVLGALAVLFVHGLFSSHGFSDFVWGGCAFCHDDLSGIWKVAAVGLMVSVAGSLLTGYALYTRQPWGRILAIVMSVLAVLHLPLGTALAVYTLWVLAPARSGAEYERMTVTA